MITMQTLSELGRQIRNERLQDAVERFGRDTVEGWAEDPEKVRALNALAEMEADRRRNKEK